MGFCEFLGVTIQNNGQVETILYFPYKNEKGVDFHETYPVHHIG